MKSSIFLNFHLSLHERNQVLIGISFYLFKKNKKLFPRTKIETGSKMFIHHSFLMWLKEKTFLKFQEDISEQPKILVILS